MLSRLYHMADNASWKGLHRHGLLSTEALLDLFEVCPETGTANSGSATD